MKLICSLRRKSIRASNLRVIRRLETLATQTNPFWNSVQDTKKLEVSVFTTARVKYSKRFITGLPVAQPSYKLGSVFPCGTGVFSACVRSKSISRMRRIGQRTSAEYIVWSSKRLEAIIKQSIFGASIRMPKIQM